MKKTTLLAALLALAMTLALISGCAAPVETVSAQRSLSESGTIILSVNPEISVSYNKQGLVTKLEGLNDDGTDIVSGYDDYVGKDCRQVVKELVRKINDAGYFVENVEGEGREITIQIEPGSVLPDDDFLEIIAGDVREEVAKINVAASVVGVDRNYGTDRNDDDNAIRYADKSAQREAAKPTYITRDEAAAAALAHAGIKASDAVFDDREFDFESGSAVYELEFMAGGEEYEYDVDAITGKILRSKRGDSGYGDGNDSYYGAESYGDTDYGPNSDGVTDYNDTDYGPGSDGVTGYSAPKPAARPASPTPPRTGAPSPTKAPQPAKTPRPAKTPKPSASRGGNTDYGDTDYNDTDYGPNSDGVTEYGNTNYGSTSYGNTNYGSSNSGYGSSSGNSGYGDSGYGNS